MTTIEFHHSLKNDVRQVIIIKLKTNLVHVVENNFIKTPNKI